MAKLLTTINYVFATHGWSQFLRPNSAPCQGFVIPVRPFLFQSVMKVREIQWSFACGVVSFFLSNDWPLRTAYCSTGRPTNRSMSGDIMSKTTLEGHGGPIWSVSICRESQLVAASSEDHTIKLWNAKTGESLDALEGHQAGVKAAVFAPQGRFLASGAKDRLVKMWNPPGRPVFVLEGHHGPVNAVAFSADCRFLVSGGGEANKPGEVIVWDLAKASVLARLHGHDAEVLSVAISPNRQTLASCDAAGVIKLWNLTYLLERHSWTGHQGAAWTLAFHPEGKALVSGGQDGWVKFWERRTGKELGKRKGDSSPVLATAFSLHGRQLAIGCLDGHVKLWCAGSKNPWFKLCRLEKPVYALTYSPERSLLAAGPDKNVTIWKTETEVQTPATQDSLQKDNGCERVPPQPIVATAQKLQEFISTLENVPAECDSRE